MYVVMTLVVDSNIERENILKLTFKNDNIGLIGVIPVFKTYDQAKKAFPDKKILPIKFKEDLQ